MKGIRTVLFLLGCSPVFGFAQNSKQCVADLQHLTLPAYAQIQYGDDNGETPLVYLFSEDGDDIYSAIPSNARNYVEHLYSNGISFIVVYQDERARQEAIHNLSQPGAVAVIAPGSSAHGSIDQLKFAVIHLKIGSSQDKPDDMGYIGTHSPNEIYARVLLTTGWHIDSIKYFEPQSCAAPHAVACYTKSGQLTDGLGPNWITDLAIPPWKQLEPRGDPQFVRTIEALRVKLKELIYHDHAELFQKPVRNATCIPDVPSSCLTLQPAQRGKTQTAVAQTRYCTPDIQLNCLLRPSDQQIDACRAALQHYTVPEYQTRASVKRVALPIRHLFSQDGIDVYADADIPGSNKITSVSWSGTDVLMVYQDESVRQRVIADLRSNNLLPTPGSGALVDNLKYAVVHFAPDQRTLRDGLAQNWHIERIEYDQPEVCRNIFQNDAVGPPFTSGTWITGFNLQPSKELGKDNGGMFSKALNAMLTWVKKSEP